MDANRHNLPAPSQPRRLGQPYHGLLRGGVLTLSNGRQIAWPFIGNSVSDPQSAGGDCYVLRVPGTPPVELPPAELAAEAGAGREWRSYALLNGWGRSYGGIPVGIKAWLYAAPDGTVWRIECPQLNTAILPLAADSPPQPDRWFYPATLDFEFRIRRFGLIAPDADPESTHVRLVAGQSLGGAHRADPVYPETSSAYVFPRARRFIGDGRSFQYMLVNIEDTNSTGARVLFAVNRSLRGSVWSSDYAAPQAWIEVSVTGSGASIAIEMAVLRVDTYTPPVVTSAPTLTPATTVDFVVSNGSAYTVTNKDSGVTTGTLEPNLPPQTSFSEITGGRATSQSIGRYAGAYYDSTDTVQWVKAAGLYQEVNARVSGSSTYEVKIGASWEGSDSRNVYNGIYWRIDYQWHMSGYREETTRGGALMGPHPFMLPDLIERHEVEESGYEYNVFENEDPSGFSYSVSRSASGNISGAFGNTWWYSDPAGVYNIQTLIGVVSDRTSSAGGTVGGVAASTPGGHFFGGAAIREFETVYLRRVTNKVYAVVASNQDVGRWPVPFPLGSRVVALGTPSGWISGPALETANYASYQPVTDQLAHSPSDTLGWV